MYICLLYEYVHVCTYGHEGQRIRISWSWSYRCLWKTKCRSLELNSSSLKEQQYMLFLNYWAIFPAPKFIYNTSPQFWSWKKKLFYKENLICVNTQIFHLWKHCLILWHHIKPLQEFFFLMPHKFKGFFSQK